MDEAKVTVVISAPGSLDGTATGVLRALTSLLDQDYPLDKVEMLLCQKDVNTHLRGSIQHQFPRIEILDAPQDGYYRLKNFGIERAHGEIIALADTDCVYSRHWLAQLVETIETGADVAVGFTKLEGNSLLRRLCAFYDLHQMLVRTSPRMRRFNSNNVAFRAAVVKASKYLPHFDRSGGCVQLAEQLLRRGTLMKFSAEQASEHTFYGYGRHTWKQAICSGYDFLHTRDVDPEMSLAWLTRLPVLGPPVLSAVFILSDAYNVAQNHRLLSIRWFEVPAFLAFSLVTRPLEVVGMYWARVHPGSIERFVSRNFA